MKFAIGLVALLALGSLNVAAQSPDKTTWVQTSSTAGDCSTCEITLEFVSDNILRMDANTGWVGYAHFVAAEKKFVGVLEFTNGDFKNEVIPADFTLDGKTLMLNAKSAPLSFTATYRQK